MQPEFGLSEGSNTSIGKNQARQYFRRAAGPFSTRNLHIRHISVIPSAHSVVPHNQGGATETPRPRPFGFEAIHRRRKTKMKMWHTLVLVGLILAVIWASNNVTVVKNITGS